MGAQSKQNRRYRYAESFKARDNNDTLLASEAALPSSSYDGTDEKILS